MLFFENMNFAWICYYQYVAVAGFRTLAVFAMLTCVPHYQLSFGHLYFFVLKFYSLSSVINYILIDAILSLLRSKVLWLLVGAFPVRHPHATHCCCLARTLFSAKPAGQRRAQTEIDHVLSVMHPLLRYCIVTCR